MSSRRKPSEKRRGRRPQRFERPRGLVVTEGTVTEIQYLQMLQQQLPRNAASLKLIGEGSDPLRVVKRALRERKDGDYSWTVCLVDRDKHETLQDAFRLATEEDIRVLVSNPCFELWLLWHLEDWRRHSSSRDVQARLAKLKVLQDKSLTSSFPIGRYADARARSDKASPEHLVNHLGPNPSSPIPVLLELLGI